MKLERLFGCRSKLLHLVLAFYGQLALAMPASIGMDHFSFPGYSVGDSSLADIVGVFGKGHWESSEELSASGSMRGCYQMKGGATVSFESWSVSSPYIINKMRVYKASKECPPVLNSSESVTSFSGIHIGMSSQEFEEITSLPVVNDVAEFHGGMARGDEYINQAVYARFHSGRLVSYELQVEIEAYE